MNDKVAAKMSEAIAGQQNSRTPAPVAATPTRKPTNKLTVGQSFALKLYMEQFKLSFVGTSLEGIANRFNESIASVHPEFKGGKLVTKNNVYYFLAGLGLGLRNEKVIATRSDTFTSLSPAVAEPSTKDGTAANPMDGIEVCVTQTYTVNGRHYATLQAAQDAVATGELQKFIEANTELDGDDSEELARRIHAVFDVIKRK